MDIREMIEKCKPFAPVVSADGCGCMCGRIVYMDMKRRFTR